MLKVSARDDRSGPVSGDGRVVPLLGGMLRRIGQSQLVIAHSRNHLGLPVVLPRAVPRLVWGNQWGRGPKRMPIPAGNRRRILPNKNHGEDERSRRPCRVDMTSREALLVFSQPLLRRQRSCPFLLFLVFLLSSSALQPLLC